MSRSLSQQSTQAIVGIVFGIVMCILAVIALLQGYRHKYRRAVAISTTGQPSADTSDLNIATIENGTYYRPIRGRRVIIRRSMSAWVLHKLTADRLNKLLPHIKQRSKTFSNDRIPLKHAFPPPPIVTRVFEYS